MRRKFVYFVRTDLALSFVCCVQGSALGKTGEQFERCVMIHQLNPSIHLRMSVGVLSSPIIIS